MGKNAIFNATVCIMGILILAIHITNILWKKGKRKDEKTLLIFFVFTAVHFATYLTFSLIKENYTSNIFITFFYTLFYVFNNLEALLLFFYMLNYIEMPTENKKMLSIFNIVLFSLAVISDIVNVFTGIYFYAQGGEYVRSKTMMISQFYQFAVFVVIFFVAIRNKKLNTREKTAFSLYCLLPFFAIILQNIFKGYAIAYASIIVAIEILFSFLTIISIIFYSVYGYKKGELIYQISAMPFLVAVFINVLLPTRAPFQIALLTLLFAAGVAFLLRQKDYKFTYAISICMVIISLTFSIYSSITANTQFLGDISSNWPTCLAMYLSIFIPTIMSGTMALTYNVRNSYKK